jgi:hypothetical protein
MFILERVVGCRCGHCKKLAPEWKTAAKNLKGKVKLGQVDCDAETVLSNFSTALSGSLSRKHCGNPF